MGRIKYVQSVYWRMREIEYPTELEKWELFWEKIKKLNYKFKDLKTIGNKEPKLYLETYKWTKSPGKFEVRVWV